MDQSIGKPFLRSCPDKRDRTRLTVLARLNRLESQSIKMDSKLDRILLMLSRLASCSINNQRPTSHPRTDTCPSHTAYHAPIIPHCYPTSKPICEKEVNSYTLHPNSSGKLLRSTSFSTSQIPQPHEKEKTNTLNNFIKQKVFRSQSTKIPKKNLLSPDSKFDRSDEKSNRESPWRKASSSNIADVDPDYFRGVQTQLCRCSNYALSTVNLNTTMIPALSSPPSLNSSMYTPSPEFLSSPEFCDVKGPQRVMSSINICAPITSPPPVSTYAFQTTATPGLLEPTNQEEFTLEIPNINVEQDISDIMRRRNTPSFVFP